MRLRSGCSTRTKTSGSLASSCWRKGEKGGKQPEQPRQHEPPTYGTDGTQGVTLNSPPAGSSRASTFVGPTGITSSSGPRHLHQHRPHLPLSPESCCCHHTKRPTTTTTTTTTTTYPPNDDDDDDDIKAELAELRAKEERRRAQRRASKARCRARHANRVAASKRRKTHLVSLDDDDDDDDDNDDDDVCDVYKEVAKLRAKEARRLAQRRAQRARYRAKYADRIAAYQKQYYAMNAERLRAYKRQYYRSEAGQRWEKQYLVKKREAAALRGSMVRKRTEEKRQALGPFKLTVTMEDFMQDFCNTLSSTQEDSMDQPSAPTIMDMDSGVLHSLDHSVCDMWDDGKGFLDNLLDDLSSSSDDSLFDFLIDMMQEDPSFDLDDFVT